MATRLMSLRDRIVILTVLASTIVYLDHSFGCLLLLAIGQQVDKGRTSFALYNFHGVYIYSYFHTF